MQNSMMLFTLFVFIQPEMSSLGKFDPKCQNCQFKVKLDTKTNSNMLNSMMLFTFFIFDRKYPFWANLVQIVNIFSFRWNLIPRLIRMCRIQWLCSLFLFLTGNTLFQPNLVQMINIVSLRRNLIPRLIRICRVQWCSVFLCSPGNTLLGQIWSKVSKLSV